MADPKIKVAPPLATAPIRDRMHGLVCDASDASVAAEGLASLLDHAADERTSEGAGARMRALVRLAKVLADDVEKLNRALDQLWLDSGAKVIGPPYHRRIEAPRAEGEA